MPHRHLLPNEIDQLLDGDVSASAAPLRAHVEVCDDCRALLDDALRVTGELEILPHFVPHVSFADRVMAKVHIVEPWHVTALTGARRVVPASRPLRAIALASGVVASATISASALWLAFSLDIGFQSATFAAGRARALLLGVAGRAFETTFGGAASDALRANGAAAIFAGAGALAAAVGVAAFGFRALATASRRRGS